MATQGCTTFTTRTHSRAVARRYLAFADTFEQRFVGQGDPRRTIEETREQAWALLADLPETDLKRIDPASVARYGGIRAGAPGARVSSTIGGRR